MITYKNISYSAKTFYGVKFEPGEIKEVPGYITARGMIRIFDYKPKTAQPVAKPEVTVQPEPAVESVAQPVKVETRGRKKKSIEPVKDSLAETDAKIINILSEEETSNGNPS